MPVQQITEKEIPSYLGNTCPVCGQGKMRICLQHDAMSGNQLVLKCDMDNFCSHTIEILLDTK